MMAIQKVVKGVRSVVGVADIKTGIGEDVLVTYALGSCLAVSVHDPVNRVGALLHVMLPLSNSDPDRAAKNPCIFVDTGVPRLLAQFARAGGSMRHLVAKAAGGAHTWKRDFFEIGKRNFIVLKRILWGNDIILDSFDIGGNDSRTVILDVATGKFTVKQKGLIKEM